MNRWVNHCFIAAVYTLIYQAPLGSLWCTNLTKGSPPFPGPHHHFSKRLKFIYLQTVCYNFHSPLFHQIGKNCRRSLPRPSPPLPPSPQHFSPWSWNIHFHCDGGIAIETLYFLHATCFVLTVILNVYFCNLML